MIEEDRMGSRFGFRLVIGVVVMVATAAAVGFYGYNLGWARGIAENRAIGAPVVVWPGPWFGFGFFPFFPLVILFWIFVLRGLFWRGSWCGHRRRYEGEQAG
jgi:hypothetical protein